MFDDTGGSTSHRSTSNRACTERAKMPQSERPPEAGKDVESPRGVGLKSIGNTVGKWGKSLENDGKTKGKWKNIGKTSWKMGKS